MKYNNQVHPFHLVDPSPWPIVSATGAFAATFGGVMYFHSYQGGFLLLNIGMFIIILGMFVWWRDVVREGTFEGQHTHQVELGLRMGMLLFIRFIFFQYFTVLFFNYIYMFYYSLVIKEKMVSRDRRL